MKNSNIRNFAVLALVLVAFFIFANQGDNHNTSQTVFSNFDWGKVAKIELEKGTDKVDILKENDHRWVVPARDNYTANSSEITSLTLKMADLSASQQINLNEEGLKRLGLTEDSKDAGQGTITFYDSTGGVLEKVYIGGLRNRKSSNPEDTTNLAGQYIKRKSIDDAFLVPTPVIVSPTLLTWLETDVLSVPDSDLTKITSYVGGREIFSLDWDEGLKKVVYKGEVPEGKVLEDTVVNQIVSGIKDIKMTDVFKVESEKSKDLKFGNHIDYVLKNGFVYRIQIAEKDGKKYLKIAVTFQPKEPKADADPEELLKESKANDELKEQATKLNADFETWVYEIPDYVATRFLRKFEDLFKAPVKEDSSADAEEEPVMTEG